MYQDLSSRHDRPVRKATVDLPVKMKGNAQPTSSNSLSPLGAQNQDLGAASQTLLTEFKSRGGDSHIKGAGMFVVSFSGVSSDFGLTL